MKEPPKFNVKIGSLVKLPECDEFWWSGLIGVVISNRQGWVYDKRDYSYETTWVIIKQCEVYIPKNNLIVLFKESRLEVLI